MSRTARLLLHFGLTFDQVFFKKKEPLMSRVVFFLVLLAHAASETCMIHFLFLSLFLFFFSFLSFSR